MARACLPRPLLGKWGSSRRAPEGMCWRGRLIAFGRDDVRMLRLLTAASWIFMPVGVGIAALQMVQYLW